MVDGKDVGGPIEVYISGRSKELPPRVTGTNMRRTPAPNIKLSYPDHLSPSSMSTLQACARSFYYDKIRKVARVAKGATSIGGAIDDAICSVMRECIKGGRLFDAASDPSTADRMIEVFYASWQEKSARVDWGREEANGKPDAAFYANLGPSLLRVYCAQAPVFYPIAIQKKVEVDVPGIGKVLGYIDLVMRLPEYEDVDIIVDYKTSRSRYGESSHPSKQFQPVFYTYAYQKQEYGYDCLDPEQKQKLLQKPLGFSYQVMVKTKTPIFQNNMHWFSLDEIKHGIAVMQSVARSGKMAYDMSVADDNLEQGSGFMARSETGMEAWRCTEYHCNAYAACRKDLKLMLDGGNDEG